MRNAAAAPIRRMLAELEGERMIVPVRCISCGKPLAQLWEEYKERVEKGEKPGKVLDSLGLKRYCCRALFLTHKDVLAEVAKFRV